MKTPLEIPRAGSFFEGHFPGRPILPGIALLDLALRALDPGRGPQSLLRLDRLRLRSAVLPGERLEIEAGATQCLVRRGDDVVAQADFVFGSHAHLPRPSSTAAHAPGVPDLDALLPHRPPMRLVDGIAAVRDDGVVCTARVTDDGPFTVNGAAPALASIEMAAQTAAVFAGLRSGGGAGYLVGAKDVRFHRGAIPAGVPCTAAVRAAGSAAALSTFDFEVACGGERIASGTLSTWLTPTGA